MDFSKTNLKVSVVLTLDQTGQLHCEMPMPSVGTRHLINLSEYDRGILETTGLWQAMQIALTRTQNEKERREENDRIEKRNRAQAIYARTLADHGPALAARVAPEIARKYTETKTKKSVSATTVSKAQAKTPNKIDTTKLPSLDDLMDF